MLDAALKERSSCEAPGSMPGCCCRACPRAVLEIATKATRALTQRPSIGCADGMMDIEAAAWLRRRTAEDVIRAARAPNSLSAPRQLRLAGGEMDDERRRGSWLAVKSFKIAAVVLAVACEDL